jgi:NAD(P)-dependent dehydrogenase (short-subunit alcohol dehydrogenase family)
MIDRGAGGSIINISTIEAFRGIPNSAVYSAFKGAITQFTKSLAIEVGQYGIRVNAIAPEATDTPQVPLHRFISPDEKSLISLWVPLGRYGEPDDTAGAALYLASDLSKWVTGTTVHVDGGCLAAAGWFRQKDQNTWTNRPIKNDKRWS